MRLRRASSSRWSWIRYVAIAACAFCFFASTGSTRSEERRPQNVRVGWNGHLVLGCWTLLTYELPGEAFSEAARYRLDVTATDPDGNLATFVGDDVSLAAEDRRLHGKFQLGRPDGTVILRVYRDGTLVEERELPSAGRPESVWQTHTQGERLFITVGLPAPLQDTLSASVAGKRTPVHLTDAAELPADEAAYDGAAGLLLTGRSIPDERQSAAIERWVRGGGRVYLSLGMSPAEYRAAPFARWLPWEVAETLISTRELTSLESYAGKAVRIVPPGQRIDVPKITSTSGKTLAGNRNEDFLIWGPYGCGTATVLGLDITQAPLLGWEGLGDLLRRMTGARESLTTRGERTQQLGTTGITELASQIAASLEHFESVSRTSPWSILAGLVIVLALIGPIDFWLVDRIGRKPLITWVSFPLLLIGSSVLMFWLADRSNGQTLRVNQLDVIDVDSATGAARGRHWATLYSPKSQGYAVGFVPTWPQWSPQSAEPARLLSSWCGLPEPTFGGMYQNASGAVQFGQARYHLHPAEGTIDSLPTAQWSTASMTASTAGMLSGLVESKLKSSASGRLSGTLTHRFPAPLEKWFLAFENRVYRQPEGDGGQETAPMVPGKPWQVDQPQVVQRELRGYLTQTTARQLKNSASNTSEIQLEQAPYSALSRDLERILPILTFHEEVGGTVYTGLKNDSLPNQDLTPFLDLGQAVLFGFLPATACDVNVGPGEKPDGQRTTLVRVVLPVDKSRQMMRELKRLKE